MPTIGLIGLGKQGYELAIALQKQKIKILAFDMDDANRLKAAKDGIVTTSSISGVVMHLPKHKIICLVLNGEDSLSVVNQLSTKLQPEDVLLDLGDTKFVERKKMYSVLKRRGVHFIRGKIVKSRVEIMNGSKSIPHDKKALESLSFLI